MVFPAAPRSRARFQAEFCGAASSLLNRFGSLEASVPPTERAAVYVLNGKQPIDAVFQAGLAIIEQHFPQLTSKSAAVTAPLPLQALFANASVIAAPVPPTAPAN